jgi:pimeloyl-ACP methyl ester carboxylesterase
MLSRRSLIATGIAFSAAMAFEGVAVGQTSMGSSAGLPIKETNISTNGIHLHVTEQGTGPAILFAHGFPDTGYTWRKQMQAVAAAGYHAIAPDMRGYGRSSAPADAALYTPFQTVGDLVGLLDALQVPDAIIVGHDWGAAHAFSAAMMRPDRFKAVFGLSVPYLPRGDVSSLDAMRAAGHGSDFYMFEQISPEADRIWSDAAVTIPGVLYWASGSAPPAEAWNPFIPTRSLHRAAPTPLPSWIEPDYLAHNIAEFQRTGFHGALNYYRAIQPFFDLSAAYRGVRIRQPSYFMWGKSDGLYPIYQLTEAKLRDHLPGLAGYVGIDGVGHWMQHEASDQVGQELVKFARSVSPN